MRSDHMAAGDTAGVEGLSALDRLKEEARTLRVGVVLGLSPSKKLPSEDEVQTLYPPPKMSCETSLLGP